MEFLPNDTKNKLPAKPSFKQKHLVEYEEIQISSKEGSTAIVRTKPSRQTTSGQQSEKHS